MKKKLFIVAALVGLAVVLTGCSSSDTGATPTVTVYKAPDDVLSYNNSSEDQNMLDSIRKMSPDFNSVDDQTILDTVDGICSALAGGSSGSEIASLSIGNIGVDNATTLIAAAVVVKCPQYTDLASR